ncbi:MAG: hypothetical protein DMG34_17820 [Acidobacteria bacterium]|nr:MAG: hypothetical protein DMG34_17820 [Acidobacteriota bacterium]
MLTIFSTPKPFEGHSNVIQRNAIKSWTLLHPEVEVILFGDEEGTAEACRDLAIRHEPHVIRNEHGTKYLNYIFDRANQIARHNILCYANCDIMLTSDFRAAVEVTSKTYNEFLMMGRRWDTNITEPWNFNQAEWDRQLRSLALSTGRLNGPSWVDYFCFSRDLYYGKMPPFLIGRDGWDPWLIWFARSSEVPLVDVSRAVIAVHQNHDYAYLKRGPAAIHKEKEISYNLNLGNGPGWHYYAANAATRQLVDGNLRSNPLARLGPMQRRIVCGLYSTWFSFLKITRPMRHPLGLRRM